MSLIWWIVIIVGVVLVASWLMNWNASSKAPASMYDRNNQVDGRNCGAMWSREEEESKNCGMSACGVRKPATRNDRVEAADGGELEARNHWGYHDRHGRHHHRNRHYPRHGILSDVGHLVRDLTRNDKAPNTAAPVVDARNGGPGTIYTIPSVEHNVIHAGLPHNSHPPRAANAMGHLGIGTTKANPARGTPTVFSKVMNKFGLNGQPDTASAHPASVVAAVVAEPKNIQPIAMPAATAVEAKNAQPVVAAAITPVVAAVAPTAAVARNSNAAELQDMIQKTFEQLKTEFSRPQ